VFLKSLLSAEPKQASLANAQAFVTYLAPLRNTEWVVYSKRPFGGPKAVLAYLSRYTHRERERSPMGKTGCGRTHQ